MRRSHKPRPSWNRRTPISRRPRRRSTWRRPPSARPRRRSSRRRLISTTREVRAPVGGRVSRRASTEGNLISGGTADSTLLTTIVSLDPIHCIVRRRRSGVSQIRTLAAEGKRASSRDVKNPVFLALADETPAFPIRGTWTSSTTAWTPTRARCAAGRFSAIRTSSSRPGCSPGCGCPAAARTTPS